jgi:uncharacterized YccA/Bax inhibitor family protein
MATANPAMNDAVYSRAGYADSAANVMTLQGTALKSILLVAILLATASYSWSLTLARPDAEGASPAPQYGIVLVGAIGGMLVAFLTIFVPRISPFTAPVYAALQGLFLGGVSSFFEATYSGIVIQAVSLTIGTLLVMLTLYAGRIIQATEKFKIGVIAATGAVFLVYMVDLVLSFWGRRVPFIHETGLVGIGISLVIVVIAALNLILDFDFIERGVERGAPKYMEWYGGFSLLVTLVWLYLEVLRLLAKLRGGRD